MDPGVGRYSQIMKQLGNVAGEELDYWLACLPYRLGFDKAKAFIEVPVLVNGSPKTGTTWMLLLITSLPGFRRAAGYNFHGEIQRYRNVVPGEVVHGHDSFSPDLWRILHSKAFKVVMLLRDPRDQTVSRMYHVRRDPNHHWHERFQVMNDDEALMACIEGRPGGLPGTDDLLNLSQSWLDEGDKCLCVRYEELKADPVAEFRRVLRYLDLDVDDALVRAIVSRNRFQRHSERPWKVARKPGHQNPSSHFRKGIVGDWRNHFKIEHVRRYKELAGEALIRLGYETDYNW